MASAGRSVGCTAVSCSSNKERTFAVPWDRRILLQVLKNFSSVVPLTDLLKAKTKMLILCGPLPVSRLFKMSRLCCAVLQCRLLSVCRGRSSCRWTPVTWALVLYCYSQTVRGKRGLWVSLPEDLTSTNLILMCLWVQECHWWYLLITTHLYF